MNKRCLVLYLIFSLLPGLVVYGRERGEELNRPAPAAARLLVKRGTELAEGDRFAQAISAIRQAISLAPHYLTAHREYVRVKSYFMGEEEQVKTEYEALMAKEPWNPVYPMALALEQFTAPATPRFEKVVELAPSWAWGHYAKARLLQNTRPEEALAELFKAIEKDRSAPEPYLLAISIQERQLKKIDEAVATAEDMLSRAELRNSALPQLWRLRLARAGNSEQARGALRDELSRVVADAGDVALLASARAAYIDLLQDEAGARAAAGRILQRDPSWYPERGVTRATMTLGEEGPRSLVFSGRQLAIYNKLREVSPDSDPRGQMVSLEKLLALNPGEVVRRVIYHGLMSAARAAGDMAAFVRYGEALLRLSPRDGETLTQVAMAMADEKRELAKALRYARRADEATRELPPLKADLDNDFLKSYYSEESRRERHRARRALALDARGWVLFRMRRYSEAEPLLRQSIELARTELNLSHLADALSALGRGAESARFARESKDEYAKAIRGKFKSEPARDFELSAADGRRVRLSDLRGKAVMVNFWATWCQPCSREMPVFVEVYNKYRGRGFEILAVSVDAAEDRPRVVAFGKEHGLNFPLLYDEGTAKLYGAHSFPTTIFIDRAGNIRYQTLGFYPETARRDLEIIIEELLAGPDTPGATEQK